MNKPPESDESLAQPAYEYDLAMSFAGEQRAFVEDVVRELGLPEARVFYDADHKAALWGEELSEKLIRVYRDEARYVVMFVSREYAEKEWCNLERRAALRRRMMTSGAYILPVRLDTTTLDDVEGLLGTIGYLDGLREGAVGVASCLREKLQIAVAERPERQADEGPQFGKVQMTQEGLLSLLQEQPHSWRWAVFASVLAQRREAMKAPMRDHRLGFAHPTGERVETFTELQKLAADTMHDVDQIAHQINGFIQTDAFNSVFGTIDEESTADPEGIVHVATRLMDFYDRFLQLAQRARGAAAPSKFVNVLDTCARLVDEPLAGLEDFIEDYLAVVEALPAKLKAAEGQNFVEPVEIRIHLDSEMLEELVRQLTDLAKDEDA